jgi:hypothetical protein
VKLQFHAEAVESIHGLGIEIDDFDGKIGFSRKVADDRTADATGSEDYDVHEVLRARGSRDASNQPESAGPIKGSAFDP